MHFYGNVWAMSWRLAHSLERLRNEINAMAPDRSKRSDGTVGDAAHQASASDHNPNASGVVCALDITHDPENGVDIDALTDHLVHPDHRHPALKYVIANKLIAGEWTGWEWWDYNGSNPHTRHMHVSVGVGPDGQSTGPYDDTTPWGFHDLEDQEDKPKNETPPLPPAPKPHYTFPLPAGSFFGPKEWGNESISGFYRISFNGKTSQQWLQIFAKQLAKRGWPVGKGKTYLRVYGNDGLYGSEYVPLIKAFQKDQGITVDALIGAHTWHAAFNNPIA